MKILQLISSAGFFGAENVVLELSKQLHSVKIDNIVGVFKNYHNPHTEIIDHAQEINLRTSIFDCTRRFDLKALNNITRFIENNDIDIIHAHGAKPNAYGYVAARLSKRAIISTCHNQIENAIIPDNSRKMTHFLSNKLFYSIDRLILHRFDRVVAVSEDVEKMLLENEVDQKKLSIIFNGISIERFNNACAGAKLREEFNVSEKIKIIGAAARLTKEKGLFNLLEAAQEVVKEIPNVIFMIVGDGPLKDELKKKAKEMGINDKIIFTGQRTDMPEIYSTMDIFVLPSLTEGLPLVILEAMAAMKPIVATKVGAIPRVIEDRKEGILIQPGNINELKEALLCLLKNDGYSKELSHNAFDKVVREFSSQRMCSNYIEIYEEVLKKRMQ